MRFLTPIFALLIMLGLPLTMSSCGNDPTPEQQQQETAVVLSTTTVEATAAGGEHSVEYTINNGLAGIDIVAESDVVWIHDIKAADGTLSFTVDTNNNTDIRSGALRIKYPQVQSVILNVTQEAAESAFTMTMSNITTTSCRSRVTAKDPNTIFIVYMAELSYFYAAGITTAEQLFKDDYDYYISLAERSGATDLEKFFLSEKIAYKGDSYISWGSMIPNNEYVIYAYGIEFSSDKSTYSLSTPISYERLKLPTPELMDVEFDVDVTVAGPMAKYEFEPIGWAGKYYVEIHDESSFYYIEEGYDIDEAYCTTVSEEWLTMITQTMASGYSAEQLYNPMCLEGRDGFSEMLEADSKYMISLYAIDMVDGLPQVVSRPYFLHFKTDPVGASEMNIELKVENLYVRVADVTITPTTNDPYTTVILPKRDVVEGSNEQIMTWLTDMYRLDLYTGEISSHLNTLKPETEYSILAFGYYGGVITTDLFRYDFITEAESECVNSVVTVNWGGPYSLRELEASGDKYYGWGQFEAMNWYAMWSEIVTAEPAVDVFHCIYRADSFISGNVDDIYNDLISYSCPTTQILTGENGVLYVMCAVTMDYKGNYSEMWVSEPFSMNYDSTTKRPIEELLERINGTATPSALLKPMAR